MGLIVAAAAAYVLRNGLVPAWTTMTTDFPNYYVSAKVVARGEPAARLYHDGWFAARIKREGIDQPGRFSTFPPATAFVMLPLTPLSPTWARRVWLFIGVGCLALLVFLAARLTHAPPLAAALAPALCASALVSNFRLGQLYLVIATLMTAALWCAKRDAPRRAGVLLGLGISVKYFPVVVLPVWWAQKRYSAVFMTLLTCAAVTLLEWVVFGQDTWWAFVRGVFLPHLDGRIAGQGAGYVTAYQSLHSLCRNLFLYHAVENPHPLLPYPALYTLCKWGTMALIAGWGARRFFQAGGLAPPEAESYRTALISATAMVLLPVTASYHLLLMVPGLTLLLHLAGTHGETRRHALLAAGCAGLLGFFPFWRLHALPTTGWWLLLHYYRLWLLLLLWAVTAALLPPLLRRRAATSGAG